MLECPRSHAVRLRVDLGDELLVEVVLDAGGRGRLRRLRLLRLLRLHLLLLRLRVDDGADLPHEAAEVSGRREGVERRRE